MISIKSEREISLMKKAGNIVYRTHKYLEPYIKPGITTKELDKLAYDFIISQDATPSFLNYHGYPASICVSVNDEVVHGIPTDKRVLRDGDIVSLDAGLIYKGYHSDAARTYAVGEVSQQAKDLMKVTEECFFEGIKYAKEGNYLFDISAAIGRYAEKYGYGVVRDLTGHGVGLSFHEDPEVSHVGHRNTGMLLVPGMVFTIEPMINQGTWKVFIDADDEYGWEVITGDELPSAQWEHTFLMTEHGVEILTY